VFIASLIGSLHCAGMCGPFMAFATLRPLHRKGVDLRHDRAPGLQLAYHGSRLLAYVLLGAAAGLLGATLDIGGSLLGAGKVAAVAAGVLLVAVGISRILTLLGVRLPMVDRTGHIQRWLGAGQAAAARLTPLRRALSIGVLTALLPCGWLYAFVAVAAGTGQALHGALVLLVFWAGTVPILAGIGAGLGSLLLRAGRTFQLVTAVLVVLLGFQSILGRYRISAARVAAPATSLDAALHRVSLMLGKGTHSCH
jgi:sulfite exporter TauE/SafE